MRGFPSCCDPDQPNYYPVIHHPAKVPGLFTLSEVTAICSMAPIDLHPSTVTGDGSYINRRSTNSWLPISEWQWVYDLIREEVYSKVPRPFLSQRKEDIQYTRYVEGNFFGPHTDWQPETPWRKVSVSVLLKNAMAGGILRFSMYGDMHMDVGDAVIFPSDLSHEVTMIEAGERLSLVLWM